MTEHNDQHPQSLQKEGWVAEDERLQKVDLMVILQAQI